MDIAAGLASRWVFGDGDGADGLKARHVYARPGSYAATLTVSDKDAGVGVATVRVAIDRRETYITASAATVARGTVNLTAKLADGVDAASARVAGRVVELSIRDTLCSATTDGDGVARCTVDSSAAPLGPGTVVARFAGDELYAASEASARALVYGWPAAGAFVAAEGNSSGNITFWESQWRRRNAFEYGHAPESFKGFANGGDRRCGGSWTSDPGASSQAPPALPPYMGVLVTRTIAKVGSSSPAMSSACSSSARTAVTDRAPVTAGQALSSRPFVD